MIQIPPCKYFLYGDKKTMIIINTTFSFNMLKDLENVNISAEVITWEEFDGALEAMKIQHHPCFQARNDMGHESTANLVKGYAYRRTSALEKGDVLYIPQYRGPRLKEGQITLPEGAKIVPLKITIN